MGNIPEPSPLKILLDWKLFPPSIEYKNPSELLEPPEAETIIAPSSYPQQVAESVSTLTVIGKGSSIVTLPFSSHPLLSITVTV